MKFRFALWTSSLTLWHALYTQYMSAPRISWKHFFACARDRHAPRKVLQYHWRDALRRRIGSRSAFIK